MWQYVPYLNRVLHEIFHVYAVLRINQRILNGICFASINHAKVALLDFFLQMSSEDFEVETNHMRSQTVSLARFSHHLIKGLYAATRRVFLSTKVLLICISSIYAAGSDVSLRSSEGAGPLAQSTFPFVSFGPANVCGRVKVRNGRAIAAATLTAVGGRGDTYETRTATFGYYCFIGLSAGETYIISVSARRYYFPEPYAVVIPFEDVYGIDFNAL